MIVILVAVAIGNARHSVLADGAWQKAYVSEGKV